MIFRTEMLKGHESTKVVNKFGSGNIIFVCEHASNFIPEEFNRLGLSEAQIQSHIAWDPGALAVALLLSEKFDAPLVYPNISRLLYDCNRPPGEPSAIASKSEIHTIPGNTNLSQEAISSRVKIIYKPFIQAIDVITKGQIERGILPFIVTIHSFSPFYYGKKREVEIGILHDQDKRLADCLINCCDAETLYKVRRNEPYGPADGVTHTLKERAQSIGLANVMVEIRNDLIQDDAGVTQMVNFLTDLLESGINEYQTVNQKHDENN